MAQGAQEWQGTQWPIFSWVTWQVGKRAKGMRRKHAETKEGGNYETKNVLVKNTHGLASQVLSHKEEKKKNLKNPSQSPPWLLHGKVMIFPSLHRV